MSGFRGNTAHGASEKPGRRDVLMNLGTAQRMLPLIRQILDDLQADVQRIAALQPEQNRLDRQRRDLAWPERARRYRLAEEISAIAQHRQDTLDELETLGVAMLDAEEGRVGFPTIVNDRKAFFTWSRREERVNHWHFVEESTPRPIPPAWLKAADIRVSSG